MVVDCKFVARWWSAFALALAVGLASSAAGADDPRPPDGNGGNTGGSASTTVKIPATGPVMGVPSEDTVRPGDVDRPHTVAEFEAGVIALPTAPISPSQKGGNTPFGGVGKGDATILTGLHLLYRGAPDWAFGAGFLFAPSPTSDPGYGGATGISRSHSRSYLVIGGEGRYFPFRGRTVEAWVGLAGSAVVIADRFSWDGVAVVPAILGSRSVTISTEGFSLGIQAGGNWMFADRWVLGVTGRASRWILPQTPSCSPLGDCATLTGTVEAFELGLSLGYRIPL